MELFNPNTSAQLWEDVGSINLEESGEVPPRWMVDDQMRQAIQATLSLQRAREELQRLQAETDVLAKWLINNLVGIDGILRHCKGSCSAISLLT